MASRPSSAMFDSALHPRTLGQRKHEGSGQLGRGVLQVLASSSSRPIGLVGNEWVQMLYLELTTPPTDP
jgi:hypothetical protein